jgi:hypothetical protein
MTGRHAIQRVRATRTLLAALIATLLLTGGPYPVRAEEQTLSERVLHHRGIEAIVWAMPMLNFKGMRNSVMRLGVEFNDVPYYSKVQSWRFQWATPNDTTPYIVPFWNVKDGPVVVEIPPSGEGVGIFGTLMDAWQRPLEDVGAKGKDGGLGAKYLMLPPGYDGELLPGAITLEQRTYNGFSILRPIIEDASPENLAKVVAFVKKIKIYPLALADNPPANRYIDLYGKNVEGIMKLDENVFSELNEMIQEEVVDPSDLSMMGLLASIGIEKGKPFAPDAAMKKMYAAASADALEYMIHQYHKVLNPPVYEGKKWSVLTPPGIRETGFTYQFANRVDYHARGCLYYAVCSSVKNYGTATYYVDLAEDKDGNWLDGGSHYKLNVPPNVPARDFWSVVAYDLETAAWIRDMPRVGIASSTEGVEVNRDGSVDVYFGPEAPEGKDSNWLPTAEGRRFFLLFRFYGPEPAVFDGSFQLNDIERMD